MTNSEKTRRWLEKNPGYRRQWYRDNAARVGVMHSAWRTEAKARNGPNTALRRWRAEHHYSQMAAVKLLGVSQPTISEWETGTIRTPQWVMDDIKSAAPGAGTPKAAKKESNT